ncbi:MAG: butyrate kinase [Negativicutes bacterium]|nr:butyrate kinase [Negativicutes bacterium]
MQIVLVINPGSTSTKVALYCDQVNAADHTFYHTAEELAGFAQIIDQLEFRLALIQAWLPQVLPAGETLTAVVGRGGMLKPLHSGVYSVNQAMQQDLISGVYGIHASNLGGLLAERLAALSAVQAFIVDPVSVDEFEPVARFSGLPELPRVSMLHALNIRAIALRHAQLHKQQYETLNLIVAHLGGGFSIAPITGGRMIDVNNANQNGPFSAERAGTLPVYSLVRLCYSGQYGENEMIKKINGKAGLIAYLGTGDLRVVEQRIAAGDRRAAEVYAAMVYQIGKEIGAMAVTLKGKVDAILLTGGMAHSEQLCSAIEALVSWIAAVYRYPGEDEMRALAEGAFRVLKGEEILRTY